MSTNWMSIQSYKDYRFKKRKYNESDAALFDEWAKDKNIVRCSYKWDIFADWHRYLTTGKYHRLPNHSRSDIPPHIDHTAIFKNADGKCWLTYQPYGDPEQIEPEVQAWAKERGLHTEVYGANKS